MIIEFAGVPGAGKTTIATELAERLKSYNTPVSQPTANLAHESSTKRRILKKTQYAVRGGITAPVFTLRSAKLLGEIRQRQKDMYIKNLYNLLFLKTIYKFAELGEITILDQGFLQVLWSIAYFSKGQLTPEKATLEYIGSKPQKYHFVLIEASSDCTQKRLAQREKDKKHPTELEKKNDSAESISNSSYRLIKEVARNMAASSDNISISTFSNEEPADIDRIVETLAETVME